MINSPFVSHNNIFYQPHGSAERLALLVLSMWNGSWFHFPLAQIRNFDPKHQKIANELLAHFIEHGENDAEFVLVGTGLAKAYMSGEILSRVTRADGVARWEK